MTLDFGECYRLFHRSVINGFENLSIQLFGRILFISNFHLDEGISESLDTYADGSVFHIRVSSFFNRVIVVINDSVEIFRNGAADFMEFLKVISSVIENEFW